MRIAQVVGARIPFSPHILDTPYSIPAISYLITEELVHRGHTVTVFAPRDSITSATIAPNTLSSIFIKKHHVSNADPSTSKLFGKIIHDHFVNVINLSSQFDIIHNHKLEFLPFAAQTSTPTVTTLHYYVKHFPKKFLVVKNNSFIAVSKRQTKIFPYLHFAGTVHHGIPVKRFPLNNKPKDYLGWLGRITPIKGCKEAITVAMMAREDLRLAGNNVERMVDDYEKIYEKIIHSQR